MARRTGLICAGRPRLVMSRKIDPEKAQKQWAIVKATTGTRPDAAILYADKGRLANNRRSGLVGVLAVGEALKLGFPVRMGCVCTPGSLDQHGGA
jgi:hypothetical protein